MAIIDRLPDASQRGKAILQDKTVETIFSSPVRTVLHGGTIVWRCYGGERFSKDVDAYVKNRPALEKVLNRLASSGLRWSLLQERKTTFGLYRNYVIRMGLVDVALQVTFAKASGTLVTYETVNGAYRNIVSLSVDELLLEKLGAFSDRSKARDLYDIWILARHRFSKKTANALAEKFGKPQKVLNYEELRHTVYGVLPTANEMRDAILRRTHEVRE